jgi:16S rRNA (guanine966-N2)-methyltransferase
VRIIAGTLGGRTLRAPSGHLTRPTTDRTRSAIFSLVESRLDLTGVQVLDAFAGSGALGLEALSRGAAHATFIEAHTDAFAVLRDNVQRLGMTAHATMLRTDVLRTLPSLRGSFALVLADPPYHLPTLPALPGALLVVVAPGGLLVLEHDARHRFDDHPALVTTRRYGETLVSLFARAEQVRQRSEAPDEHGAEAPASGNAREPDAPSPSEPSARGLDLFWVNDY